MTSITDIDFAILDAIQKLHNSVLTVIMKIFTMAGDNGYLWIALCILLLCIPKTRKIGIYAAAALAVEFILNDLIIKELIARERPFIQHPDVSLLIKPPGGYSFPSGHSASSFATATAIFLHNKRLGIACLITAAMIAFSRLYFYVHFPSDVLVGSLLGAAIAIGVYFLLRYISKKRAAKAEA